MKSKYAPGSLIIICMLTFFSVVNFTSIAAQQLDVDTTKSLIIWDDYELTGTQRKLTPRGWFRWWYVPVVVVPPGAYLLISGEDKEPPVLPPVINCLPDQTLFWGQELPLADPAAIVVINNCPQPGLTIEHAGDSSNGSSGCVGDPLIIQRTYTVTDACGNSVSCTQDFTFLTDSEAPSLSCPADVVLECTEDISPANTGNAIATDNCTPQPEIVIDFSDDTSGLNGCNGTGTIARTWSATDNCGNSATCVQTITVEDTTAPVFTDVPADIAVDCANIPPPYEVVVVDNCTPNSTVTLEELVDSGCPYTITRTWTVIDECGNASVHTQAITVEDNTAPVISCPIDVFVICGQSTDPAVTGMPLATDDCAIVNIEYTDDLSNQSGCSGFIIRTFTVIDECGNSASCEQVIDIIEIPGLKNNDLVGQWMVDLNPNRFLPDEWDGLQDQSVEDLAALIEHPPAESSIDFHYFPNQYGGATGSWFRSSNVSLRFGIGQLSGNAFADLVDGVSAPIQLASRFHVWKAFGGLRHYFSAGSVRLFSGVDLCWGELAVENRRFILNDQHIALPGTVFHEYLDVNLKAGLLVPIGPRWAVEMEMSPVIRTGRGFAKSYNYLLDLRYRFW